MLPVTISHKFWIVDPIWVQMVKNNKVETLADNIPLNINIVFIPTLYIEHWTLWTIYNLLGGKVEILFMDPLNNIASSDLRELFKIFVGSIQSNKETLFI
jgi:hypothetical protein